MVVAIAVVAEEAEAEAAGESISYPTFGIMRRLSSMTRRGKHCRPHPSPSLSRRWPQAQSCKETR